ncbi:MAG TPA: GNAT family N-acetyltransferase [Gammaproteobacteria bacterium]|nr:GNAT family N-acetyltransferase [Gammaproteobacteria bacterium]
MPDTCFRVESARLYIRPWEPSRDRDAFTKFVSDSDMMRYISFGRSWDEARIDAMFKRQAGFLAEHGCCVGAAVLKETGEVAGVAGIQPQDKSGYYELAWWVWKDYWNRGYATELAHAMKDHAFRIMGLKQCVAIADVPNLASIRVMQKIGMRYEGLLNAHDLAERHPDVEVVYYTMQNPALLA